MRKDKQMAFDWLIDCLTDCEADGYQQHETAYWYDLINGFTHDGQSIFVEIGESTFRIDVTKIHRKKSI